MRTRSRLASANATARDRSFREARRHTWLVRFMRLALPMAALTAIGMYGVGMKQKIDTGRGHLTLPSLPTFTTENLTMANPRYEGFNPDGSKFVVAAATATQDLKQKGPIGLTSLEGRLTQVSNVQITLTAPRGTFDNTANVLELFDDIKVRTNDGIRADLTQATVNIKDSRIVSKQPVAIDLPAGQIRANEMELLQATHKVIFTNGVNTRLTPPPRPAEQSSAVEGAGKVALAQSGVTAQRMIGSNDGPVDVSSHNLIVDDEKKTAVFAGEVLAKQGEATLRTPMMEAYYGGPPVPLPGIASPTSSVAALAPAAGKLKRLVIPNDVTLTQGADRVTSDAAEFDIEREAAILVGRVTMNSGLDRRASSDRAELDTRADTTLLSGNVVVEMDKNILRSGRLELDRKAGATKLLSPPITPGQPPGRISARFMQAVAAVPPVRAAPSPKIEAQDASGFVFRTDPGAPIDIDAETLNILDKVRTATFRGAVHAVQGQFTIRTPELVATYSGEAGLGLPGGAVKAGDAKQNSAQLTRVRANQKVEVTSDGQSANGDWADFDVKSNKVTIGGNVTIKRGKDAIFTPKATIDMITGLTYLEPAARAPGATLSFSPTEQRAPYTLPDLPSVKQAPPNAPPAFATNPAACPKGQSCVSLHLGEQGAAKSGTAKGATAPPWQTDTAPPPKRTRPAEASGWVSTPQTN